MNEMEGITLIQAELPALHHADGDGASDLSGKPIIELLRELAAAAPYRIAVTAEEGSLTRGELDAESDLWAGELVQLGVHAGDYVCIVLPNGLEFVTILLGVWKAGAVPVPLNDRLAVAELVALVDLIGPSVVVGGDSAVLRSRPHLASGHRPAAHPDIVLDRSVLSPSWKVMASSGSTGRAAAAGCLATSRPCGGCAVVPVVG